MQMININNRKLVQTINRNKLLKIRKKYDNENLIRILRDILKYCNQRRNQNMKRRQSEVKKENKDM